MQVIISCKLYGNQADRFMRQTLYLTLVRNRYSSLRSCDASANKFVAWIKTCQYLKIEKITRRFNYKHKLCQNAAPPLNGLHLNIPSTKCRTLFWASRSTGAAWAATVYERALAPWAIFSISGNDDTKNPHRTFWCMIYDCSTHFSLW